MNTGRIIGLLVLVVGVLVFGYAMVELNSNANEFFDNGTDPKIIFTFIVGAVLVITGNFIRKADTRKTEETKKPLNGPIERAVGVVVLGGIGSIILSLIDVLISSDMSWFFNILNWLICAAAGFFAVRFIMKKSLGESIVCAVCVTVLGRIGMAFLGTIGLFIHPDMRQFFGILGMSIGLLIGIVMGFFVGRFIIRLMNKMKPTLSTEGEDKPHL